MSQSSTIMAVDPKDRIVNLVTEVIIDTPLFLVEVVVRGRKGSQVVEVFLDSEVGLNVEDLARVSREVSFLMETEEVMSGKYHLNVSSPGVDRPLLNPRQYPKHIGRALAVRYSGKEGEPSREANGTLRSADQEGIVLSIDDKQSQQLTFDKIVEARVVLPW